MEITKENFADFIALLRYHNRGPGVKDHITANPLFVVQSKRRIHGISLDYDPETYWTNAGGDEEFSSTEELMIQLEVDRTELGITFRPFHSSDNVVELAGGEVAYERIGYAEEWVYVNAHLTKESAEAFIKRKRHDHEGLRIYVDSQNAVPEFNALINALLSGCVGFKDKAKTIIDLKDSLNEGFGAVKEAQLTARSEDIPPVGVDYEYLTDDEEGRYERVIIITHFDGKAVFYFPEVERDDLGLIRLFQSDTGFRKIRTEREITVEKMVTTINDGSASGSIEQARIACERLYDCGEFVITRKDTADES